MSDTVHWMCPHCSAVYQKRGAAAAFGLAGRAINVAGGETKCQQCGRGVSEQEIYAGHFDVRYDAGTNVAEPVGKGLRGRRRSGRKTPLSLKGFRVSWFFVAGTALHPDARLTHETGNDVLWAKRAGLSVGL